MPVPIAIEPSPGRHGGTAAPTAPAPWAPLPVQTGASLMRVAPPQPALLGPVAPGTLTLIRGPRGAGKSWLALSLAHAIAGGGAVLGWSGRKAPVLYVEAAMGLASMTRRLRALGPVPAGFGLLCDRDFDLGLDIEAEQLAQHLPTTGPGVLVLDGLSLLVPPGRQAGPRWDAFCHWLRTLRRAGHAVVLVDHACRPSVVHLADTVLTLKPMPDEQADIALSVQIASREPLARADRTFAARLDLGSGTARWTRAALVDPVLKAVADQAAAGATVRDIADALGLSPATAWRRLETAKALGLVADGKPGETNETRPAGGPAVPGEARELAAAPRETAGPAPPDRTRLAAIGGDARLAECAARVPPRRAAAAFRGRGGARTRPDIDEKGPYDPRPQESSLGGHRQCA